MRKRKLMLNLFSSLILQIVIVIGGFVLPKLIIEFYGSISNGLINSITQFLSIITFLDGGVGAVIQSALYEPLANNNKQKISEIICSGSKVYKSIARILILYIVCLVIGYPLFVKSEFESWFISLLIIIIATNLLSQYYVGIVDNLLLQADQRGYVLYSSQISTNILNLIVCTVMMYMGASIHFMKFASAVVLVIRPILVRLYVNRTYNINRRILLSTEPIKQKWNGIAQHISYVVMSSTDIVVLSVFSNLYNVSIYAVYNLVIQSINQLILALSEGVKPLFGELWSTKNVAELRCFFSFFEWIVHNTSMFIFGCTVSLIVPFVEVYTKNVTDVNYIQPFFAFLITIATLVRTLSLPYWLMILAAGHYKETQYLFIISSLINIIVSVVTVFRFGLIGVAIGTLLSMLFQLAWMVLYNINHIMNIPAISTLRYIIIDICIMGGGIIISNMLKENVDSWMALIIYAFKIAGIWSIIVLMFNILLNYKFFRYMKVYLKEKYY